MIYRGEPHTLMIFNRDNGITATLSDNELFILETYLKTGDKNEFIERLMELKLMPADLSEDEAEDILHEIEKSKTVAAPLRSFAVPEAIHIDLTTVCPLNCPYCYKDTLKNKEMSFETFSRIIYQAEKLKVFQIAIGGGEPLLVKNLPEYVKKVSSCKMACTITTSGYGLTEQLLKELKVSGVNHIQVSLNGSTREIHSCSRDGFDYAISALELLSKNNVLFGINWVARMDNVRDFENIVAYAKKLGADNINILRYKPAIREEYIKNALTHEAFYELIESIKKVRDINIKVDCAFSSILCCLHGNQINPINSGCGAGRRFMMIDPYGNFKPCSHMHLVSEEKDILQYWIASPDLEKLRQGEELIDGVCRSCHYLKVCRGCRGICEKIYMDINRGERNCPVHIESTI